MATPLTFGAKEESEIGSFKLFLSRPAPSQVLGTISSYISASSDLQDSAYIRLHLFNFYRVFICNNTQHIQYVGSCYFCYKYCRDANIQKKVYLPKVLFLGNWYRCSKIIMTDRLSP